MKIIVDAFGGDFAPDVPVEASVMAVNSQKDLAIILTGKKEIIEEKLSKFNYDKSRIEVVDCCDVITNDEEPVRAVKRKKDSSMVVGAKILAEDGADAFLSMGSTGALLATALLIVGRIKGVLRPALATMIPTDNGGRLLLDAGANTNCKPETLLQFAKMGSIYMEKVYDIKNPKVGLVNNGAEEKKGTTLTKEAHTLLKNSKDDINFIGNLEGREMMEGAADVIVCDGFTGNIILKTLEGMGKTVSRNLKEIFNKGLFKKFAGLLIYKELKAFKNKMDYRVYGGAPLIGIKKPVIKGHGSSDVKAAYCCIIGIEKMVSGNVTGEIEKAIKGSREVF